MVRSAARSLFAQAPGQGTAGLNNLLLQALYQVLPADTPLYEQVRMRHDGQAKGWRPCGCCLHG